ncbi:hypothetical protein EG329_008807 [Mollisiaceae sp. DMI_Dod_QoI]|nr:hypothetical protein EG329_008807 [Helotiales sp. DMI_Dod_QoI]
MMISWSWILDRGTLLVGRYSRDSGKELTSTKQTQKIVASFDLDSTLIVTKSGKLHAADADDWTWWNPSVPDKLRSLSSQGYRVVIFSNQGRLTTASEAEAPGAHLFKQKLRTILTLLDVPLTIYVACANDIYRKPRMGMWEEMLKEDGHLINGVDSYFVGDAAGRESDHSDSDIHFCENLAIKFKTPEAFFFGVDGEVPGHKFHPTWFLKPSSIDTTTHTQPKAPELVVFVGLPGAGKTTYFKSDLEILGYTRINLHDDGEFGSYLELVEQSLAAKKSVVVDGTNEDPKKRKQWVSLAHRHGIQARAFYFNTPSDLCLHNDSFRALAVIQPSEKARRIYPRIAFRKLEAKLQPPTLSEGFYDVIQIEFKDNYSGEASQTL